MLYNLSKWVFLAFWSAYFNFADCLHQSAILLVNYSIACLNNDEQNSFYDLSRSTWQDVQAVNKRSQGQRRWQEEDRPSIPVTSHHSGWQTRHSKHGDIDLPYLSPAITVAGRQDTANMGDIGLPYLSPAITVAGRQDTANMGDIHLPAEKSTHTPCSRENNRSYLYF